VSHILDSLNLSTIHKPSHMHAETPDSNVIDDRGYLATDRERLQSLLQQMRVTMSELNSQGIKSPQLISTPQTLDIRPLSKSVAPQPRSSHLDDYLKPQKPQD
jgi:hypothetical protein